MTDQEKIAALEAEIGFLKLKFLELEAISPLRIEALRNAGREYALMAERDALAALVAEKDACLSGLEGISTRQCWETTIRPALEKSHPPVERARLVAEVVEGAIVWSRISGNDCECLRNAVARLTAHDAGGEKGKKNTEAA